MARTIRNYLFDMHARGDWVRLRTLLGLRWVAVAGQATAVLLAHWGMGFQLPLAICALLISASISVNVAAHFTLPAEMRLNERWTLASLFFDLIQLVLLLMATGGLNNPFAVLILAPVTISATALRLRSTLWLGIAAMIFIAGMSVVYLPLVQANGTPILVPEIFRAGISAALAIGVIFLSLYARRVTVEAYGMSEALNATQVALAREQRLAAIGGLAAAAAHELGTPLATIKLVASELKRELADTPELAEDAALIRAEADRCAAIMADLSRSGRDDKHVKTAPLSAVIEEAAKPHRDRGKEIILRLNGAILEGTDAAPIDVNRSPELIHGLRNLIQNAVDFAHHTVWIDIFQRIDSTRIVVGDDGPGFGSDVLPRLGEPYISTRNRTQRNLKPEGYQGMGLGLFIAKTLLDRTGAQMSFANGSDLRSRRAVEPALSDSARPPGAIIEIIWANDTLVRPLSETRRALGPNTPFDLTN